MCGICGIYGTNDKTTLRKMNDTLSHRGQDDEGFFIDTNIGLAHKRLSIIDIKGGQQPIHNEDETIWITFNGEIYNFKELKACLEKKHRFYTNTDTEVIIHVYEEYGLDFVNKLNGMFAFAIWDSSKKRLLLARDHLGKKPLYYYHGANKLIFASEIKAILAYGIKPEIDTRGLYSYLAYQYVPGNRTMFKNINKLLPGNVLLLENNQAEILRYWGIVENIQNINENTASTMLKQLLETSAKYRMISDVPIGAFLSGGIDSSAVVALSRPHANYDFHTFSIDFESFSELEYAKKVSEHVGTIHHETTLTARDVLKNMETITRYYDEPLGDAAIINLYFLSKEAKKHNIKVVLSGDGGDEVFAGYQNYKTNPNCYNRLKSPTARNILKTLLSYLPNSGDINRDRLEKYLLTYSQKNFDELHMYSERSLTDSEIDWLTDINYGGVPIINPVGISNDLNKMLALDCYNLLPEKFLMKADKSTMANGIEERMPLLDKDLVEFTFTLPPSYKLNGQDKHIFRLAVKDLLPPEIIYRKKQGFGTPIDAWVHGDMKDDIIKELSDNAIIKTYFKKRNMDKVINRLSHDDYTYGGGSIWTIYALCKWHNVMRFT